MKKHPIDISIKRRCAEMRAEGMSNREIYNSYFRHAHSSMNYETFKNKMPRWAAKAYASDETLNSGTYEGFIAHDATVQVDGDGKITQAWIRQTAESVDWEEIIDRFSDKITPVRYEKPRQVEKSMLEIPLFDMHFGVADENTYKDVQREIIEILDNKFWDEINILIGQDLIHTNDMRGHTAKGTDIQRIDVPKAWEDAFNFWAKIISEALQKAKTVHIRYSKGNHDECISWCFLKTLEQKFPDAVIDDSLVSRKVILWNKCFIGYGHCEYTNTKNKLFRDFVCEFPQQFSESTVREIHTGHLHSESIDDGMMVRRLASAVPVDEWSYNNGYASAHKRFQIFEWQPGRLKAIYYI